MQAETILNVARKHWGIENNLHWQLDVSFNEDNQKKKKNAAQNISLINNFALAKIKQDETKGSMKTKRKRAGWDSSFLLTSSLRHPRNINHPFFLDNNA